MSGKNFPPAQSWLKFVEATRTDSSPEANGCPFKCEGGSHTIYWNPKTGRREPVPRHSEIPDILVRKICRALGIQSLRTGEVRGAAQR